MTSTFSGARSSPGMDSAMFSACLRSSTSPRDPPNRSLKSAPASTSTSQGSVAKTSHARGRSSVNARSPKCAPRWSATSRSGPSSEPMFAHFTAPDLSM